MGKVVQLGEYRTRNQDTAASAAVDDIEEASPFAVSFSGTPDEIFDGVVTWLSTGPSLPDVVITRPGYIEFADVTDDDDTWRERYEDSLWEDTMPMCDTDESEDAFSAATFLALVCRHPIGFKTMVTGGLALNVYHENDFLQAFYRY